MQFLLISLSSRHYICIQRTSPNNSTKLHHLTYVKTKISLEPVNKFAFRESHFRQNRSIFIPRNFLINLRSRILIWLCNFCEFHKRNFSKAENAYFPIWALEFWSWESVSRWTFSSSRFGFCRFLRKSISVTVVDPAVVNQSVFAVSGFAEWTWADDFGGLWCMVRLHGDKLNKHAKIHSLLWRFSLREQQIKGRP